MSLDPREFIRVHSGMPEHPKVEPLSDGAFRALVEAWCLCRRSRNDGLIPLATWNKRWKLKARKELIAAGLAHLHADGVEVHDWLEHQPSAAELEHNRSVRAEAGRKGGKQSGKARQRRSMGEANDQANAEAFASGFASPPNGHETVTSEQILDEIASDPDLWKSVQNQTRSDAVQTALPADSSQNGEAIASVLLDQTLKPSRSKTQPDSDSEKDMGRVGEKTYVSSAGNSGEKRPPPTHHAEHPEWDPDCPDCTAVIDDRIDFQVARVDATPPPSRYCPDHPDGTGDSCRPCGVARRARIEYDATQAAAHAAQRTAEAHRAAEVRRAAIAACHMCDPTGYHGTTVCDHDPERPERARRRLAEIRASLGSKQLIPADHES
ncbi:hypothetical protein [Nocardia acidivorans]|uniref:hypothetical protein n=1 Tax=Nocardia acidivorans TaxID=404580 RepID=UPI000AF6A4CB|nr:hypothetical protein [Nocardia acidivorans]